MTEATLDLTGRWHGIFNYPDGSPPNEFDAELREATGLITGETREPSDGIDDVAREQCAFLEGTRSGHAVRFVKRYDELHRDAVYYDGTLDDDAKEIAGRWTIQGVWSGTFLMIRPTAHVIADERVAEAPVG